MANFLLEIGTEELPARFLRKEETDIVKLFTDSLNDAALPFESMQAMATPRRLVLFIKNLADAQSQKEEIVTGPPAKVAFNPDGSPSKALTGFAKSQNVDLAAIFSMKTKKGEYMAARQITGGTPAAEILAEICIKLPSLPFAKSMRWGSGSTSYARPIRWMLALIDSDVVDFTLAAGLKSGRLTYGHRVHGIGPFTVPHADAYKEIVANQCCVTLDPQERIKLITEQGNAMALAKNAEVIWDDNLLQEVSGLVEHPVPLLGDFDPKYLEIPEQVLLTSMQTHQKSFGLRSKDGKLVPHFLTVLNIDPEDPKLVKNGWERVLRARLEDARFFWQTDLAATFDQWLEKLEHVIFIGPLGSMADKTRRLQKLCAWLAGWVLPDAISLAERAGRLSKADLVSGMVGEFDTLQGLMGGIYADRAGENPLVAEAIKEQYLPSGPDSPLPESALGAILAIADKADTLAGCFGLDMIPTGLADPNGLRRCALGIIRILLDRQWEINIRELLVTARKLYGDTAWKLSEAQYEQKILEFFTARLRHYFISQGYDTLFVDAAISCGIENVPDCKNRLDAIVAFSKSQHFEKSAQILKRVENISKKADQTDTDQLWKNELLQEEAEIKLAHVLKDILPVIDENLVAGRYSDILRALETLHHPVNVFFDNVMVLCDDPDLRLNRLRLLAAINKRFAQIAKFSTLQI